MLPVAAARHRLSAGRKSCLGGLDPERDRVFAKLESGKTVHGAALLYSVGRQANSDQLNLEAIGLVPDGRGKLLVDENFRTAIPHIYAAGDVIGFPALASTSMEQGRLASCHIFGISGHVALQPDSLRGLHDSGNLDGRSDGRKLTRDQIPYETGIARYAELAKGQMLGDDQGFLKLIFDPYQPEASGRPHYWRSRRGDRAHRAGGPRARRHHRVFSRQCLQLPDTGGSL